MKLEPEVRAEIGKMTAGCLLCSVLMGIGFAIAGRFGSDVLWGCLLGFALSAGNFALLSVGISRALETGDELRAKRAMRTSYLLRTAVMLGALAAALVFDGIHWLPIAASLFYVRILITVRNAVSLFRNRRDRKLHPEKYENEDEPVPAVEPAEEEEEETEDEFEKFVSRFARGAVPGTDSVQNSGVSAKQQKDSEPPKKP